MARITIVRWRDIPAQVIVGKGRGAAKVQLPERFEQAIDRAAMKAGAKADDAYLAQWRREDAGEADGAPAEAAARVAARIEADHPDEVLRAMIAAEGHAPAGEPR